MLVLCALSDLLLCPGAGIMTGEALVLRVTRMTAKHAGEHRGSVGKGRGGGGALGWFSGVMNVSCSFSSIRESSNSSV